MVRLSRSGDGLDVTDEASVAATLGKLEGSFDLIFVATGALVVDAQKPEKALAAFDPAALLGRVRINALGPALILKHALPLLPRDHRAVFAALLARVGSIGDKAIGGWYSYRTTKAALNQLLHTAAIELRRTHKQAVCVALHPGTIATDFTAYVGRHKAVSSEDAARNLVAVTDGLTQGQSGGFFDCAGQVVPW